MRALRGTISDIARTLNSLLYTRKTRFSPGAVLLGAVLLSFSFSFSSNKLLLIAGIVSIFILASFAIRDRFHEFLKLYFLSAIMVLVIMVPKIMAEGDNIFEASLFILNSRLEIFVCRVLAPIGILIFISLYLGFWNLALGLKQLRLPNKLVSIIFLFGVFLVRLFIWVPQRILGRYSRLLSGRLRDEWLILASVIVDLFMNSLAVSKRFYLGLISRGFDMSLLQEKRFSFVDVILILICFVVALLGFLW